MTIDDRLDQLEHKYDLWTQLSDRLGERLDMQWGEVTEMQKKVGALFGGLIAGANGTATWSDVLAANEELATKARVAEEKITELRALIGKRDARIDHLLGVEKKLNIQLTEYTAVRIDLQEKLLDVTMSRDGAIAAAGSLAEELEQEKNLRLKAQARITWLREKYEAWR